MIYSGKKKKLRTSILELTVYDVIRRNVERVAVIKLIFNCASYAIWEIISFILDFFN